jgi:hypothetical protein
MSKVFTKLAVLALLISLTIAGGCGQKENSAAIQKKITEGAIKLRAKHNCVRKAKARIFLSKESAQGLEEDVKQAVDLVLGQQPNRPVLWVHLDINVNNLFDLLHKQNSAMESFKKGDFLGIAGNEKLIPVALNGLVEVNGLNHFLQQDLIFQLPENVRRVSVVIDQVSLVEFSF